MHPSSSVESVSGSSTRLDVAKLASIAAELLGNSIAPSTARSYTSVQQQYYQFCSSPAQVPVPASENTLILFVAYLTQKCCHSSVQSYLSIRLCVTCTLYEGTATRSTGKTVFGATAKRTEKNQTNFKRCQIAHHTSSVIKDSKGME